MRKYEYKHCPFCKGTASLSCIYDEDSPVEFRQDLYSIYCDECFVRTDEYETQQEAEAAWEQRVPDETYLDRLLGPTGDLNVKEQQELLEFLADIRKEAIKNLPTSGGLIPTPVYGKPIEENYNDEK